MINKQTLSDEKGVAIITVLGFTAILLSIMITFLNIAVLNKKMSENYNSLQRARMSVQTGYNRALAVINYSKNSSENIDLNKIYSSYNEVDGSYIADSDELPDLLRTIVNGSTYTPTYTSTGVAGEPASGPYWQYLKTSDDYTDTKIVARIAYVVRVDDGKIDPSASVDSGLNLSNTASSETSSIYSSLNCIGRPGKNIHELFLMSADCITYDWARKLSSTNASGGLLEAGERWGGFIDMFDKLGITDGSTTADSFRELFAMNIPADPEAFWLDNGDEQRDNAELYHSFNLSRNDWHSIEVDSLLEAPVQFDENTIAQPTSINWFRNWSNMGGFSSSEVCRNQIAANLIDYSDMDNSATTDSEDAPSFVGLERVPFINEIALNISGEIEETASAPFNYRSKIEVSPLILQLVNMYETGGLQVAAKAAVTLEGSYIWSYRGEDADSNVFTFNKEESFSKNIDIDFSVNEKCYSTVEYASLVLSPGLYSDSESYEHATHKSITDFKIDRLRVKLMDSSASNLYDFAYIIEDNSTTAATLSSTGSTDYLYFDSQIDDPRQNLLQDDWTINNWDDSPDSNVYSRNSSLIFNPNPDIDRSDDEDTADYEPSANDPWDISTAYIRNEAMKSPWEVGFIHRGAKWQTLNLKRYNNKTTSSLIGAGGGGSYSDGDANILDQIRMTDANLEYGKINLNTSSTAVLKVLFQKVCIGSNKESPGSITGNIVDTTIAEQIASSILSINGVDGGTPLLCRSALLDNDTIVDLLTGNNLGLNQNNDALMEEIVGKFINLTKAKRANLFNIIVVAQAIKDIPPYETYIDGKDYTLATQKILVTVLWDNETKKFKTLKYKYLND